MHIKRINGQLYVYRTIQRKGSKTPDGVYIGKLPEVLAWYNQLILSMLRKDVPVKDARLLSKEAITKIVANAGSPIPRSTTIPGKRQPKGTQGHPIIKEEI